MAEWRTLVRERLAGMDLDPAIADDVVEEVAQHLDDRYRGLLAGGLAEAEARARSLAEIDGHPRLQRDLARLKRPLQSAPPVQDPSGSGWRALLQDLQFAWRRLRHAPGFAAMAIVTLALAVGANTAILSFADAVLFRPLPYADPSRVFTLRTLERSTGTRQVDVSSPLVRALDDADLSVGGVGLVDWGPFVTVAAPNARTLIGAAVSANYFRVLGVRPARGRLLDAQDAGTEGRTVVLSFAAWQQYFGADERVVGTTVPFGNSTFDVVGVLPREFFLPSYPLAKAPLVTLMKPGAVKGGTSYPVIRLARGVTRERAQARIDAAAAVAVPGEIAGGEAPVLEDLPTVLFPVGQPAMRFLLVAAGLVLLIGCANLAHLMLVRGRRSERETAVRLALGARRMRIVRPLMFETVTIGMVATGLALATTTLFFDTLLQFVPQAVYRSAPVGVSGRVVVATVLMAVGAIVLVGVIPAWRAAGIEVLTLLQNRGRRRQGTARMGRPLVAVQVALAVAVVFGATVATRAFVEVLQTPLGFSPDSVALIQLAPPPKDTQNRRDYYERAIEILAQRTDVAAVSAGGAIPFSGQAFDEGIAFDGSRPGAPGIVHALPGYFETLQIPLLAGRTLTSIDLRSNADMAVVSARAAAALFPGADPVGQTFRTGSGRALQVVGVVGDVRERLDEDHIKPTAYVIPGQSARVLNVVARLRDRRPQVLVAIREALRGHGGQSAEASASWLSESIESQTTYRNSRFQGVVLGTFGLLGLGLSTLGVFGVMSSVVVTRTREMGVRLAIGATPRSLVFTVVRQVLAPVVIGLAAGLLLIRWGRGLAEAQLHELNTRDPWTMAIAMVAVTVAALLAAYLPARRATRIDPVAVLRAD